MSIIAPPAAEIRCHHHKHGWTFEHRPNLGTFGKISGKLENQRKFLENWKTKENFWKIGQPKKILENWPTKGRVGVSSSSCWAFGSKDRSATIISFSSTLILQMKIRRQNCVSFVFYFSHQSIWSAHLGWFSGRSWTRANQRTDQSRVTPPVV